jgi:hypothetical protein
MVLATFSVPLPSTAPATKALRGDCAEMKSILAIQTHVSTMASVTPSALMLLIAPVSKSSKVTYVKMKSILVNPTLASTTGLVIPLALRVSTAPVLQGLKVIPVR